MNVEENIEEMMGKIGVVKQETRVYLALLELQESRTGKLCNYSNVPSSKIYKILDSLIKKGLVNYKVKNNIRIFIPSSPEILSELFKEKQKKLEEERKVVLNLISQLKKKEAKEVKEEPYSNYKYYESFMGIKSMWNELISKGEGDIIKVYTGKRESYERLLGFYDELHKIRLKKKIKSRIIFPMQDRKQGLKRKKLPLTEVRYMKLNNLSEWGVFGDFLFLMYITKKIPRAFLIKDLTFFQTFEQVFDQIWKIAKK